MDKRKTVTSTSVKQRYIDKTYKTYKYYVRLDDPLLTILDKYMDENSKPDDVRLSGLVVGLLREHFKL